MKIKFVQKRQLERPNGRIVNSVVKSSVEETAEAEVKAESTKPNNKKKVKKGNDMTINEKMEAAEAVMDMIAPEVKVVKKDRGLIERTESSKIILTEDNRQVLND